MHFAIQILIIFGLNLLFDFIYFHYTFEYLEQMIHAIQNTHEDIKIRKNYAVFVYLCMAIGLYINVLQYKDINGTNLTLLLGALFGFLLFVMYDFTNIVIFEQWTIMFSIRDIMFGTLSFFVYTLVICLLENNLS